MNALLLLLSLAAASFDSPSGLAQDKQDDPAEFRRNVDQAIDKGVEWLKKKQQPATGN